MSRIVDRIRKRMGRKSRTGIAWGGSPVSIGYELEQPQDIAPRSVWEEWSGDDDPRDLSGPWEISIPRDSGVSYPKSVLTEFDEFVEDTGGIWEWKRELSSGDGCGCHFHLAPKYDSYPDVGENHLRAIVWNTAVVVAPMLMPFWSWTWKAPPFRGSNSNRGVSHWAGPQSTRFDASTIASNWGQARSSRDAVTLNSEEGGKPPTVEIRIPETHPSMVMTGASILRSIIGRCIDRVYEGQENVSPVIKGIVGRNGEELSPRQTFYDNYYGSCYNLNNNLRENMAFPGRSNKYIKFGANRGIPGLPNKIRTGLDAFLKILTEYTRNTGSYKDRVARLARSYFKHENDGHIPPNNNDAMFEVFKTDVDEFSWNRGPEVK